VKHIISFALRFIPRHVLQLFSHWVLKVVAIFYKGHKVSCSVCNHSFRKFLPYGRINSRPNALCPNCLSLERHRLMWLYLQRETDFFTAQNKALHIAPELCFIDRFKALKNLEYTTADLVSPLADVKMDVHDIPFEENVFDVAFCNHVMEHVDDDIKAMSEIRRVLKPGGWAIIQVPFFEPVPDQTFEDPGIQSPSEREKAFGQDDHVRMYGKDYPDRLRMAGFTVEENRFVEKLTPEEQERFALPVKEFIYVCHK
jgi:SAM-dependent methyltransferase